MVVYPCDVDLVSHYWLRNNRKMDFRGVLGDVILVDVKMTRVLNGTVIYFIKLFIKLLFKLKSHFIINQELTLILLTCFGALASFQTVV